MRNIKSTADHVTEENRAGDEHTFPIPCVRCFKLKLGPRVRIGVAFILMTDYSYIQCDCLAKAWNDIKVKLTIRGNSLTFIHTFR